MAAQLLELGREPLDLAAQLAELDAKLIPGQGVDGCVLHGNPIGPRRPADHLLARR